MAFRKFDSSLPAESSRSIAVPSFSVRGGRRRAICIGIDKYRSAPLSCCVKDARRWAEWFAKQGFEIRTLLDEQATRGAILGAINELIQGGVRGDVIAIQYSGHGTQLPDESGDDLGQDEALVPVDHLQAGYVIDDDLSALCDRIPDGVNVTFFMDCCHSGTNTRLFIGSAGDAASRDRGTARFLPPSSEMLEAHRRSRQSSRGLARSSAYDHKPEILFAGCEANQLSYESNGTGHFTDAALATLAGGLGTTNGEFLAAVRRGIRNAHLQNPELWSDERFHQAPLLGPHASAPEPQPATSLPGSPGSGVGSAAGNQEGELSSLIAQMEEILDRLRNLTP